MGQTQSKVTKQDEAILALKLQRDKLQQYQKRMAIVTARETAVAKECIRRGEKSRALLALRRKKMHETMLSNTDKQLEQLEQLVQDVEFARVQKDVLYGLQQGTMVLKMIQKEMGSVENVEKLLAEGEEARIYLREMSDTLAGRISNGDEDEVEDELEKLEREVNGVKEPDTKLPDAPTDELQRKETQKERWERRAREQREEREAMLAS